MSNSKYTQQIWAYRSTFCGGDWWWEKKALLPMLKIFNIDII